MTGRPPSTAIDPPDNLMELDRPHFSESQRVPGMLTPARTPAAISNPRYAWSVPDALAMAENLLLSRRNFSPMDLDPPHRNTRTSSATAETPWRAARLYRNPIYRHRREHAHAEWESYA